jgi:Cd2+/Zn2+-exporting ATPase/Cu+-exporting ATPase
MVASGPGTDDMSEIWVARAGRCLGTIWIADVLRPEAVEAVRRLRAMEIRTVLLTGDKRSVADAIGTSLGVDEIEADLLPEDKLLRIKALKDKGRTIAMIGDGINDVPALVEADVGIAMGSGTDIARESAPVVLIGNDLSKFVEAIQMARRCRRIIMTNFTGTLVVDGIGLALSAFGLLIPLVAAFIHVSSELAFILNSARLLPRAAGSRRGPLSRR